MAIAPPYFNALFSQKVLFSEFRQTEPTERKMDPPQLKPIFFRNNNWGHFDKLNSFEDTKPHPYRPYSFEKSFMVNRCKMNCLDILLRHIKELSYLKINSQMNFYSKTLGVLTKLLLPNLQDFSGMCSCMSLNNLIKQIY